MRITSAEREQLLLLARKGEYRDSISPPWERTSNIAAEYDFVAIPGRFCLPRIVVYIPREPYRNSPNHYPFIQWELSNDPNLRMTADWVPHLIRCLETARDLIESVYHDAGALLDDVPRELAIVVAAEIKVEEKKAKIERQLEEIKQLEKKLSFRRKKVKVLSHLEGNETTMARMFRKVIMTGDGDENLP